MSTNTDVPCAIEILDTHTGELVGFEDAGNIWLVDGRVDDFMWAEGNYACDCNRRIFWYQAQGLEEPDPAAHTCGMERYLVRATRLDTGDLVFDEIEHLS